MIFPLVGNEKIKQSLTNAINENRLPHAILIEGDSGTGRHILADFISMSAVCSGENSPCGECASCHLAKGRNHPDISFTAPEDGKKNIAVSQIRNLRNEAFVKPHMSAKRVFVIDYADTLNEQSQNALLKVLEEPPGAVVFILIAETKASLLDTIISRCVIFTLSTPEFSVAKKYLLKNTDFSEENISDALYSSQNNIGQAISILSGKGDSQTVAAAKQFLNCMRNRDYWGMIENCAIAEKNRIEADRFFKDLKYCTARRLRENTESYEAKILSRLYTLICELEKSLSSNINLSLLCCTLVSKAAEIII